MHFQGLEGVVRTPCVQSPHLECLKMIVHNTGTNWIEFSDSLMRLSLFAFLGRDKGKQTALCHQGNVIFLQFGTQLKSPLKVHMRVKCFSGMCLSNGIWLRAVEWWLHMEQHYNFMSPVPCGGFCPVNKPTGAFPFMGHVYTIDYTIPELYFHVSTQSIHGNMTGSA